MNTTPSPWTLGEKTTFTSIVRGNGNLFVAEVASCTPEAEANARLIAAAPELLAALELALRYLENPEVQAIPFALHASVPAERARAAIAKAKGES